MGNQERLCDIACEVRAVTEKAIQIYDGMTTTWIPKSQCEQNDDGTVTMPEWLAKERGLI